MFNLKEKPIRTIIIILIVFVLFNILGMKAIDLIIPEQSQTIFYRMVDDAVEKSIKKHLDKIYNSDFEYPVTLLVEDFGKLKTSYEVENKVKFLEENGWNAQIAAIKVVARNEYAKTCLKKRLYDENFIKIIVRDYE
jgi:hypothetical protein